MAQILIVDDDPDFCYALERIVRRMEHSPLSCSNLRQCRKHLQQQAIDAIFLDVLLPDGNGLELLPEIASLDTQPETIIVTGAGDSAGAELAMSNGAWDYISKVTSVKDITLILKRALRYRDEKLAALHKRQEKVALQRDAILGNSGQISACLDKVAQSAGNEVSVIITGETGTGKELFARAIHENSERKKRPFVVVDCASLSETLTESVLFGHRKGAFTGADSNSKGLIAQAHGGTLFLDEIGELPLATQKTFLRVLQERTIRPVGGKDEILCDFRLVAATNRDLEVMVGEGEFRSDLFFRLQSFHIHLPPLRERLDDIDTITTFYINRTCDRLRVERKGVSSSCFDSLNGYGWPGNVRELVNCLEQTVVSAGSEPTLYPKHLPLKIRIQEKQAAFSKKTIRDPLELEQFVKAEPPIELQTLQEFRESVFSQAERVYLESLIKLCNGSIPRAICISGLSQSRLYALIKKHDLRPPKKKK